MCTVSITAHLEPDTTPGKSRYSFTLHGADGAARDFIIDVPDNEAPTETWDTNTTDVWVLGQTVQVGDTPADGFATYTPAS